VIKKPFRNYRSCRIAGLALTGVLAASPAFAFDAHYSLTISTSPTTKVSFSNGVFQANGMGAILNVNDLSNALAAGAVEVTTGNGYGGWSPGDIHIEAGFTWSSSYTLSFDAYHSITVDQPLADTGTGALTIATDDKGYGGTFGFEGAGKLTIANLFNTLTINGNTYTLAADVAGLAAAVNNDPQGYFALASSYDASGDGTYHEAPISYLAGVLEGLGNTISNLSISTKRDGAGLIANVEGDDYYGIIADLNLSNVSVRGANEVGSLAGIAYIVSNCHASGSVVAMSNASGLTSVGGLAGAVGSRIVDSSWTGTVESKAPAAEVGGLAGEFDSDSVGIIGSSSAGTVTGGTNAIVGGLAGEASGAKLERDFATASVSTGKWDGSTEIPASAGGLIGIINAPVSNSYASGNVAGRSNAVVGGMFGITGNGKTKFNDLYSTGAVTVGRRGKAGGFVGWAGKATANNDYWDTTTSGTQKAVGRGRLNKVSGLTTTELQSALPKGFNPGIWAIDANINGGFPYLIKNPPQ
jgi:hypothetical protein